MQSITMSAKSQADDTFTIKNILSALEDVVDWKSLGVHLDIRYSKLEEIDVNNCSQVQDCKFAMISFWLKSDDACSWKKLVDALKSNGLHALAEGIRGKYCPLYQGGTCHVDQSVKLKDTSNKPSQAVWNSNCRNWSLMILLVCIVGIIFAPIPFPSLQYLSYQLSLYHSTSIPYGIQNFMGRSEEVQNISNIIRFRQDIKHVMLIGPPGFGKSTLAIHVAHECMKYGFTVYYVDMDEVRTVSGVSRQILKCAEILTETPGPDRVERWARDLSYPVILILDNCDSVMHSNKHAFQRFISSTLHMSEELKLITTSRETISILNSERHHLHVVNELSHHDASMILHSFGDFLTDEEANIIANLTGCSPLALQVIGSIFKGVAPPTAIEIITQLNTNPIRTLSPDQLDNQVNASIYLSYKYLDEKLKIVGQYLAYFPGSFDERVACDILRRINSSWQCQNVKYLPLLSERSLLKFNGRSRRYQFHILIKEFFRNIQNSESDNSITFFFYFVRYYTQLLNTLAIMLEIDFYQALQILEAEKHNFRLFLHTISDSGYIRNTSLLIDFSAAITQTSQRNVLKYHFTRSELLKPAYVLLKHTEQLKYELTRKISNATYFQLYVQLVLSSEDLLNSTSEQLAFLESKRERIESMGLMLNDTASAATYSHYISRLADHYYERGNHSAVRLCHARLQERTRILQDCIPSSCLYSNIALNYRRVGDLEKANKFFEAALKHEKLSPVFKGQIYGLVYAFYSRKGYDVEATAIADAAAEHLPYILNSKSDLLNVDAVLDIIATFERMGKQADAEKLLQQLIDTVQNAGSALRKDVLLGYMWSLAVKLYRNSNYSKALNSSLFVYKHHNETSGIEINCIQLLIGLAKYHLGQFSDSISNLRDSINFKVQFNTCEDLMGESCFYLIVNMKWTGYRECMIYPMSTIYIYTLENIRHAFSFVISWIFSMPITSTASNSVDGHTFHTNEITETYTTVQPYAFILQLPLILLVSTLQSWIWHVYKDVIALLSVRMLVFIVNCVLVLLKLILVFSSFYFVYRFRYTLLCVLVLSLCTPLFIYLLYHYWV